MRRFRPESYLRHVERLAEWQRERDGLAAPWYLDNDPDDIESYTREMEYDGMLHVSTLILHDNQNRTQSIATRECGRIESQ
jgi:hypothetical protein